MSARLRLFALSLLLLTLSVGGGLVFARSYVVPELEAAFLEGLRQEQIRAWELLVDLHERAARSAVSDTALVSVAALASGEDDKITASSALIDRLRRAYGVEILEVAIGGGNPVRIETASEAATPAREPRVQRPLFGVSDGGFRQDRNGVFLLTATHSMSDGRILLASFRLSTLLDAFVASGTDRRAAVLVDNRGQPAERADPSALLDNPDLVVSGIRSEWPLIDQGGRIIARVVTTRTGNPIAPVVRTLEFYGAVAACAVLFLLGGVLARGFALEFGRIEAIVSSYTSFAVGQDDGRVHVAGADEAGRLAASLGEVRRRDLVAQTLEISRRRQRRRQDRFLRGQLTALAATLDEKEKSELLATIKQSDEMPERVSNEDGSASESVASSAAVDPANTIMRPPARGHVVEYEEGGASEILGQLLRAQSAAKQDDFSLLAIALENLAFRIRDNSAQLKSLLSELQDALRSRNEFQLLQQELEIARQLQRSILPADRPRPDGVGVHGLMLPARNVGGDFYDVLEMANGSVAVIVADVSGKGVPAAFFGLITRTLIKATGASISSPAAILGRVNDILCGENERQMFVTCFLAIVHEDGTIEYVNAGHNPPCVVRADGSVDLLTGINDLALAVLPDYEFTSRGTRLAPGELLLLYTDGVTEACNNDMQEYGEERLLADLRRMRDTPTFMIPRALANAVATFEAGADQADDVTVVALGYRRA